MCCRGGEIGQVADGEDELCGVVVAVQRDWWRWLRLVGVGVDVMSESGLRWLMWRLGLCGNAESGCVGGSVWLVCSKAADGGNLADGSIR